MTSKMKKGSVTVEAAIILPIMIVGILTLAYLMKVIYYQELTFHAFMNEARRTATEAYIYEFDIIPEGVAGELLRLGPQNRLAFETRMSKAILVKKGANISDFEVEQFQYLFNEYGIHDLIRIKLSYQIHLNLPIGFIKKVLVRQSILARAWTGSQENGTALPFAIMEREAAYSAVYVFPKAGEKYHSRDCSYIASDPSMTLLSERIKREFKPCSICEAMDLKNGAIIFCYKNFGIAYHSADCPMVKKYVIAIDAAEAIEKGYLSCSKCQGGI